MWIVLPIAGFAMAVVLHGAAMRLPMHIDSVRRFLMVGFPLGFALVAFSLARFGFTVTALAAILLYALLCELYMFFFTLVISSVSATLLIMLRRGPIEERALATVYDPDEMVRVRLERLLSNGFVEKKQGRLAVTRKGMKFHRAFNLLRRAFGHEPA